MHSIKPLYSQTFSVVRERCAERQRCVAAPAVSRLPAAALFGNKQAECDHSHLVVLSGTGVEGFWYCGTYGWKKCQMCGRPLIEMNINQ